MKLSAHPAWCAVVVLALTACAPDPTDSGSPASTGGSVAASVAVSTSEPSSTFAPNGDSVTVQAIDNSFRPEPVEISAGTEVVFENRGRNDHNVLPKGDPSASLWGVQKEQFAPGDRYAHVFDTPGTFAYYCSIHGTDEIGMVGTIVVTEP